MSLLAYLRAAPQTPRVVIKPTQEMTLIFTIPAQFICARNWVMFVCIYTYVCVCMYVSRPYVNTLCGVYYSMHVCM